jgi:hypothetical protein
MAADKPSDGLIALLGKALTDKDLRAKLFADPDATAREFQLSEPDAEAIKKLEPKKFEHAAGELANRPNIAVKVQVTKRF